MMLLAVILGAFGAHALKSQLSPEFLESYKTGIRYQMIHALAIMIFAQASFDWLTNRKWIMIFFKIGIILFSFSIYLLTLAKIIDLGSINKVLGPITPLGGLSLIIAWILIVIGLIRKK